MSKHTPATIPIVEETLPTTSTFVDDSGIRLGGKVVVSSTVLNFVNGDVSDSMSGTVDLG